MVLGEKFWKEIRGEYNQQVPRVQIMMDCGASHRVSTNRLLQIIHPQNWPLCDKCTIYESDSGGQKEIEESTCESALLLGGQRLLCLLLELLGASRARPVTLLRLQGPCKALEQRTA